jgi:MSHA biogenesis protein MshN
MSVINQLLLDLEKRRASGAERSVLPGHVRALPNEERPVQWGWIATGGVAAAAMLATTWVLMPGGAWTGERALAAPVPRGTDVAIERVVAASAGVVVDVATDAAGESGREAPASRLSFELSNPPPAAEPARGGVPAERVLARAVQEPRAAGEARTARDETAKPPLAVAAVKSPAETPAGRPDIQKQVRQPTPRDLAENEYRKATALLHQGRLAEAQEGFQAALAVMPAHHGARQGMVGLLLDARKYGEAERVLHEGLALAPAQLGFAMTLARLQVDRGEAAQATATLRKGLEHAQGSADYLAFLAALLQRQGRHEEAIEQFQFAIRARPAAGVWWLGLGISLQATGRPADAQEAYARARATNTLSPELATFAEQRIKQLQ